MFSSVPSGWRSGVAVIGCDNLLEPAIRQAPIGLARQNLPIGPLRLGLVRRLNVEDPRGPSRLVDRGPTLLAPE